MKNSFSRRNFLKASAITGIGLGLQTIPSFLSAAALPAEGKRIGIIGLDTSHSVEFTKVLNAVNAAPGYEGYRIVAAYPKGSPDIQSSVSRIPAYTDTLKSIGVKITESIEELLTLVDVVMLETNDGRVHLDQAIPVLKSGKRTFIDKPVTASLADGIALFALAKHFNTPVFSASSLRYTSSVQDVAKGKIGKLLGADAYSPCSLEKTHPDFFWYGIHGVEILYTVMGTGCKEVTRIHTDNTDIAVGKWANGTLGTFRGTRSGKHLYGGTAFGENGNAVLGPAEGYEPLLKEIIKFFDTGIPPVPSEDTLEMLAFMEAADKSKEKKGQPVALDVVWKKANAAAQSRLKKIL